MKIYKKNNYLKIFLKIVYVLFVSAVNVNVICTIYKIIFIKKKLFLHIKKIMYIINLNLQKKYYQKYFNKNIKRVIHK